MIRIQDIADMAGVSRTTVSNVIRGNTKRVSQETIDKITKILDEQNYVPSMVSMGFSGNVSKIIGLVIYHQIHGMNAVQDTFVGELLGTIEYEVRKKGYYLMLISAETSDEVVSAASAWNMEGLIVLGYSEQEYLKLKKKLNKKMILVDTYPENEYTFQNVGIEDYDGGYLVGEYLLQCGYDKALMIAETKMGSDYHRWLGFKAAMEKNGQTCDESRYIIVGKDRFIREGQYAQMIPEFLEAKAVAFSSDFAAIEAMSILQDKGYRIPEDISIVGFDDNIYATKVSPKLTTIRQNVPEKARTVVNRLLRMIDGEKLPEMCIRNKVELIKRESVKE